MRQREDLLEVVADEEDRGALTGDEADHVVEGGQRLVRDRSGGLVEDDDPAARLALLEGAGDGDSDAFARGERRHHRLRVDRDAEELEGATHCRAVRGTVDPTGQPADGVEADADVLTDTEVRHESEVLVHEGQALSVQSTGVDGRSEMSAVDEDLAPRVGAVDAADELDQGRLAGAVLSDQGVDLAAFEREVGVVEHRDARERLGQPAHLQPGRGRRGGADRWLRLSGNVSGAHGSVSGSWSGFNRRRRAR